jgi:thiol-disulfide isomerase/thioredoxin
MSRLVGTALSLALALLAAAPAARAEAPAKKPEKTIDLRSAELYLRTLEGKDTKLLPFSGSKMTLVNLWATWCGPCREEMPALDRLHKKYKAQGFQVVGVDIDEAPEAVKRFLAKQKLAYPVLLSTPQKTVPALGDLEALPTSLLLDAGGDVLEVLVGGIELPYLEQAITKQLGSGGKAGAKK